jgi:hypothetical protein
VAPTPEGLLGQRLGCHVNAPPGGIPPFLLNKLDGQIIPVLLGEPESSISVEASSSSTGFEDSLAALAVLRGGDYSRAAGHEDNSLHSSYQSVSGESQSRLEHYSLGLFDTVQKDLVRLSQTICPTPLGLQSRYRRKQNVRPHRHPELLARSSLPTSTSVICSRRVKGST